MIFVREKEKKVDMFFLTKLFGNIMAMVSSKLNNLGYAL